MISELMVSSLPGLTGAQCAQFDRYYDMLTDWNSRMNLTAITDIEGVAQKHFLDSVLPIALIPHGARVVDVGTGAGFPGVPIKIVRPDIKLTLVDSLNKRVSFLKALADELHIEADCIHSRAEDIGRGPLRASFDIALTRAVAGVSPLLEYTLPLLRVGGASLMYKGPQAQAELSAAKNALTIMHTRADMQRFEAEWGERCVIRAVKLAPTDKRYPRKAGTAERDPL